MDGLDSDMATVVGEAGRLGEAGRAHADCTNELEKPHARHKRKNNGPGSISFTVSMCWQPQIQPHAEGVLEVNC